MDYGNSDFSSAECGGFFFQSLCMMFLFKRLTGSR